MKSNRTGIVRRGGLTAEELQDKLDLRNGSRSSRHGMKDRKKTRRERNRAAIREYQEA